MGNTFPNIVTESENNNMILSIQEVPTSSEPSGYVTKLYFTKLNTSNGCIPLKINNKQQPISLNNSYNICSSTNTKNCNRSKNLFINNNKNVITYTDSNCTHKSNEISYSSNNDNQQLQLIDVEGISDVTNIGNGKYFKYTDEKNTTDNPAFASLDNGNGKVTTIPDPLLDTNVTEEFTNKQETFTYVTEAFTNSGCNPLPNTKLKNTNRIYKNNGEFTIKNQNVFDSSIYAPLDKKTSYKDSTNKIITLFTDSNCKNEYILRNNDLNNDLNNDWTTINPSKIKNDNILIRNTNPTHYTITDKNVSMFSPTLIDKNMYILSSKVVLNPTSDLNYDYTIIFDFFQNKRSTQDIRLIGKGTGNNVNYSFWIQPNGYLRFIMKGKDNKKIDVIYDKPLPLNKWNNIALSFNQQTLWYLYLNNNLVKSNSTNKIKYKPNNQMVTLGGPNFLDGKIKNIYLLRKTLYKKDIQFIYNQNNTPVIPEHKLNYQRNIVNRKEDAIKAIAQKIKVQTQTKNAALQASKSNSNKIEESQILKQNEYKGIKSSFDSLERNIKNIEKSKTDLNNEIRNIGFENTEFINKTYTTQSKRNQETQKNTTLQNKIGSNKTDAITLIETNNRITSENINIDYNNFETTLDVQYTNWNTSNVRNKNTKEQKKSDKDIQLNADREEENRLIVQDTNKLNENSQQNSTQTSILLKSIEAYSIARNLLGTLNINI